MRPSFLKNIGIKSEKDSDEIRSSITIDRPAETLFALWRKPETLPVLMNHFATIDILNHTDSRWRVNTPFGALIEWQARIIDEKTGEYIHWRSLEGARIPNEGRLSFRPAPSGTGTEVTLMIRFDPPGGLLGKKISQMFDILSKDMLTKTLQRFKSLAENDSAG
ncbi:cyclase [Brenneria roseae subsp. americana]|uniref:Cyclase n=1 Tax=Brenneria roseae subsp. americana TaxID=1508507 RepID=A0A2U1TL35_9GAMM|nr:SRPBCC family protein [Brenneria roseae]PWC10042.1 cyclase [Brenneria roseae subsp. americana]